MRMSSNSFQQNVSSESSDQQKQTTATKLPPLPPPLPHLPLYNTCPSYFPREYYLRNPCTTDLSATATVLPTLMPHMTDHPSLQLPATGLRPLPSPLPQTPLENSWSFYLAAVYYLRYLFTTDPYPALQGYLPTSMPDTTPPSVLPDHSSLQTPSLLSRDVTSYPLNLPLSGSVPVDDTVAVKTEPASDTEGAKDDSLDEYIDVVTVDDEDTEDTQQMEDNHADEDEENMVNEETDENVTMMPPHRSPPREVDAALTQLQEMASKYGGQAQLCPSIVTTVQSIDKVKLVKDGLGIVNPNFQRSAVPSSEEPGLFRCSSCRKEFKNKKVFNRHKENHLPSRRYLCLFCPKGFNDSYDLKRHTRTHTGSLPFSCSFKGCDKAFAQRVTMESHLQKIHGVKTPYQKNERRPCLYVCELCHTTYSTREELMEHNKTTHPNDPCHQMLGKK